MFWRTVPKVLSSGSSLSKFAYTVPVCPKRLAGHSHWQNVRHTKEAKDKVKSATAQYYRHRVIAAIRAGGGVRDPKLNSNLADVLAEAKANSVPSATLERAIAAAGSTVEPYVVEVQATGGLFILIESCASPVIPERQKIKNIVKRYGCTVPNTIGKITSEFFNHIGLVLFKGGPGTPVPDLNAATDLGIEVGATEVEEFKQDDETLFQFHCEPQDLETITQALESTHNVSILTSNDTYIPRSQVSVSQTTYNNLSEMYQKIRSSHEHVDRIFDNTTLVEDK